jgi:hypothetical protein
MSAGDAPAVPSPRCVWNELSSDDQKEFARLRQEFEDAPKVTSRDRRLQTFPRDLRQVISFIERSPQNAEARAIVVGLCFVGALVCINTRQLKTFMARSKSSINGSFQTLGYQLVSAKSKARECCLAAMPGLRGHRDTIRQWTARVACETATHRFPSSFAATELPELRPEDLFHEQKTKPKPTLLDFESPIAEFEFPAEFQFQFACSVESGVRDDWPIELGRETVMQSPIGFFDDLSIE